MIFDSFDRIRVVNLAHRRDRRAQMEGELRRIGLAGDPRVSFFPAFRPEDRGDFTSIGARGVYASQKAILDQAAEAGESVLILEDDCDFEPHVTHYEAPEAWDIFYGGYEPSNWADLQGSDIIGAHMMGFSATGARLMSNYLRDLSYTGIHPPIDGAYVWFRRAHPGVVTHFAAPPLGHQRSSRTDIASLAFFDRWPGLRSMASAARRINRGIRRRPWP
jgi:glycosyl transferase family 25